MKNEKTTTRPRSTSRKSVVQAIAKQDKEAQKKLSANSPEIQEAIRLKAYEIFIQRGGEHGNHFDDWIAAEQIILNSQK